MATDASNLIGMPQMAAVRVMSKGSTAKMLTLGTLGIAMAEHLADRRRTTPRRSVAWGSSR